MSNDKNIRGRGHERKAAIREQKALQASEAPTEAPPTISANPRIGPAPERKLDLPTVTELAARFDEERLRLLKRYEEGARVSAGRFAQQRETDLALISQLEARIVELQTAAAQKT